MAPVDAPPRHSLLSELELADTPALTVFDRERWPPIAETRNVLLRPEAKLPWSGVLNTTKWAPICDYLSDCVVRPAHKEFGSEAAHLQREAECCELPMAMHPMHPILACFVATRSPVSIPRGALFGQLHAVRTSWPSWAFQGIIAACSARRSGRKTAYT